MRTTREPDDNGERANETTPDADATRTSNSAVGSYRESWQEVAGKRRPHERERYRIIGEHGRGGLGKVSRAHDVDLGRDVAIKELISRTHLSEVRFLREALITARLEHPGIVPVHEAGRWPDGTPFYAMKLVAGRSLRELIAERSTVEQRIGLLHHVIAVADAIAYAHGRNIIHRDLKPSNVIVGDFGETVVIDWGLAKDLTASDESSVGDGPFRAAHDDGLTSAGAILGTPAYMAPEQARGEHVDQRADVFAIGAMLWEICTLDKLPAWSGVRRSILVRSKIDADLVTIIEKALQPDPHHRYDNAGELAADLKAFKAGARIAARHYSRLAVVAHWTRRHRALSVSMLAAFAVALLVSVLYVRNIAVERERAVRSEELAERSQVRAEASLGELTLKHAELLLSSDPAAALDALATYRGNDLTRADQLRAEASGRGAAVLRATPHTDAVHWMHGNPDGSIVSFSVDGTIARTAADGAYTALAKDVVHRGVYAYSARRHLLAYACDPADLCLLDVVNGRHERVAHEPEGVQLDGVDFSPDGTAVASITQTGELRVFDIADVARPTERHHVSTGNGVALLYVAADTIAVGVDGSVKVVHLDGGIQEYRDPDGSYWDVDTQHRRLALATTRGQGLIAETDDLRIASRASLCRDEINGVRFIPGQNAVAFICSEGTIGVWELSTGRTTPRAHVDGHAHMLEVGESGDYLVASSDSGVLTAVNLTTGLTTTLRGHGVRLVSIVPPTPEYPFFLSGDVRGQVRAWPLPLRVASLAARTQGRFRSAAFNAARNEVIAVQLAPRIATYSAERGLQFARPHDENAVTLAFAGDGTRFATYGASDTVEVWNAGSMSRARVIHTQHGSVSYAAFLTGDEGLITAGRDGRLMRWFDDGRSSPVATFHAPITAFTSSSAGQAVVATADGNLWRTSDTGPVSLRTGAQVTALRADPDGSSVWAGDANGDLISIDTVSWRATPELHAGQAIRSIVFADDRSQLAVADAHETLLIGRRRGADWAKAAVEWTRLVARVRDLAFARDGLLVVACAGGAVWLHSPTAGRSLFLPIGTVDLTHLILNAAGTRATVLDDEGRMISIDLDEARRAIASAHGLR